MGYTHSSLILLKFGLKLNAWLTLLPILMNISPPNLFRPAFDEPGIGGGGGGGGIADCDGIEYEESEL